MTPIIYDIDYYAEQAAAEEAALKEIARIAARDRRMSRLAIAIGAAIALSILKLLEVSMSAIIIIVCIIAIFAIFLDWIEKSRKRREADDRAEQLKDFVEK